MLGKHDDRHVVWSGYAIRIDQKNVRSTYLINLIDPIFEMKEK